MAKEVKVAVKAVRLARTAIEYYLDFVQDDGGKVDYTARPELTRIKAEVDVLMATLDDALARVETAGDDG